MDRLSYILTLIRTLTDLDRDCAVDFDEQVEALKAEADEEIAGFINSKGARQNYTTVDQPENVIR